MKLEVKADGLATSHIPFMVENHHSQDTVGSLAKEPEGPGARGQDWGWIFSVSITSWNLSLMLSRLPPCLGSSEGKADSEWDSQEPAQFSPEPQREADACSLSNPLVL